MASYLRKTGFVLTALLALGAAALALSMAVLVAGVAWMASLVLWDHIHPAAGLAIPVLLGFAFTWNGRRGWDLMGVEAEPAPRLR